jgi:hypothetical protein
MRSGAILFVALAATAWVVACAAGWDDVPPSATATSKDYPCGIVGVPCTDRTGAFAHTCCWQGETCGSSEGSVGCPADACCDVRSFDPSQDAVRKPDAGPVFEHDPVVRVVRKQTRVP